VAEVERTTPGGCHTALSLPLLEQAMWAAEAARSAFPDQDSLHLAALIHGLGKLLAHAK
jgi:hypothetical protein